MLPLKIEQNINKSKDATTGQEFHSTTLPELFSVFMAKYGNQKVDKRKKAGKDSKRQEANLHQILELNIERDGKREKNGAFNSLFLS